MSEAGIITLLSCLIFSDSLKNLGDSIQFIREERRKNVYILMKVNHTNLYNVHAVIVG